MRVLLVHSYYSSDVPSGENNAVDSDVALLRANGHSVLQFAAHSPEDSSVSLCGKYARAIRVPWNSLVIQRLRSTIEDFDPDVVHVHNTWPSLSNSVFYASEKVPFVVTLHNFRMFCANGIAYRDGHTCTSCLNGKGALPGLVHKCLRGSLTATLPVTASIVLHRMLATWTRKVDAFIVLTIHQRSLFLAAGVPSALMHIRATPVLGDLPSFNWHNRRGVLFLGRLAEEKGVLDLLAAWQIMGESAPELTIAGSGPLRDFMVSEIQQAKSGRIKYLGMVSKESAAELTSQAALLIVPSVCFEGFPVVIADALSRGTPIAVSALGGMAAIAAQGDFAFTFEPNNPSSIANTVLSALASSERLEAMSGCAREFASTALSPIASYQSLLQIYGTAIQRNRGGRLGP